ncbi:serine/threonine protein phosphatase 1 [Paenibacillus sp. UNC496MF]|uniref:metallophosphoesterase family protein n=1 Tax=Paenibacillus sp. UNC496MF TaxID=1502753 RepID=UPI0008E1B280|nr:metallophosphoesterase family protein [Paenibacillus sp. UNC496MF]SFJ62764.1 serine/threonine protein phosphatase 1 [Paenibacillus sp. UNC496MF]
MKRLLACSDIHGQHKQLVELLEKCSYDPANDQLILCGDYTDRGPSSRQVIELVKELVEKGAIALRGNHDDMMIHHEEYGEVWTFNGGDKTIQSYGGKNESFYSDINWMQENLKWYHETDKFIFVHAGVIPCIPLHKQRQQDLIWTRFMGKCDVGKIVVHGHTPVDNVVLHHDQLFIDTGSVFGGKLSMVNPESGEVWAA